MAYTNERKRCCCNCGRLLRIKKSGHIETYCELKMRYVGYVQCFDGWCRRWKKDRKWESECMNWIKTGKTTGPDGTVIFYELAGTEFWIESRTEHVPHANGIGTWDHTTYVVRKGPDCPELAVKNRLRDAKQFVEEFMGGAYRGDD